MADGFKAIPKVQEGGVSLVSAKYANEIIDLLNSLGNGQFSPIANIGSLKIAGGKAVWDFQALDTRLRAIEALVFVNGAPPLNDRVEAIENRLDNASISAEGTCSENNITINVSLNI